MAEDSRERTETSQSEDGGERTIIGDSEPAVSGHLKKGQWRATHPIIMSGALNAEGVPADYDKKKRVTQASRPRSQV